MWIENPIFREDMEQIIHSRFIPWDRLDGKTIFITGATGLIGYYLVSALMYKMLKTDIRIQILVLVRDMDKAMSMFAEQLKQLPGQLEFISGSLESLPNISEQIDYIIHAGGPTISRFFVEKPVETLGSMGIASWRVLELARRKKCMGMVYLSSMEVYGRRKSESPISETESQVLNALNLRDNYPISKCFVENACLSFYQEYKVPVNVVRLSQTIGTIGMKSIPENRKIVEEIIDCILEERDIILKTKGTSKRTYIYVSDAVTAILMVLCGDQFGQIYNVAARNSFCSIWELAMMATKKYGFGKSHVLIQESNTAKYPPANNWNLSTELLNGVGWYSSVELQDMIGRTLRLLLSDRE